MNPDSVIYPKPGAADGLLWARSGKNVGRRYPIGLTEHVMGRASSCDIEVEDDRASLQHAKLIRVGGRLRLCDLGSTNGTFVNDQRIDEVDLHDGDLIQIGETVFEYVAPDEAALAVAVRGAPDSAVPRALREGARQMLRRERIQDHAGPSSTAGRALIRPASPALPVLAPVEVYDARFEREAGRIRVSADDEDDVSMMDILRKVRRLVIFFLPYWKSISAASILGLVLGALVFVTFPPPRKAVFQISLEMKTNENPIQSYQRANINFFKAAQENFLSPPLVKKTLSQLGNDEITLERVDGVMRRLEFTQIGLRPMPNSLASTYTYQGAFADPAPEEAVRFLDQHLKNFLDTQIEKTLKVIQVEVDFLEKQLAAAEEELNRKEWELLDFKRKNIDALPDSARQYYSAIYELQRKKGDLRAEMARISTALSHDRAKLNQEDELTTSRVTANKPYDTAIQKTKSRIATLESEGKGAEHPEIVAAKAELKRLEALAEETAQQNSVAVESTRNSAYDNTRNSVFELQKQSEITGRDAAYVEGEIKRIRGIVDRLPELEATHSELQRRYEAAKTAHTTLLDKLKAGKLQLELERASAVARYDIIRAPSIEYESPKKPLMIRMVALGALGLVFGLGFATFRRLRGTLKHTLKELALATSDARD